MSARLRPYLRILQPMLALGLLVVLWQVADGGDAMRHIAGAEPALLAAAFATLTAQTVLSALRWRLVAGQLGIVLGPAVALREYYLSQIVNQALPGGVLGDAGRAVRAREQAGLMRSGQAVVFERLAGQIALLSVLLMALVATLAVPGGVDWPKVNPAVVAAGLAGFFLAGIGLWVASRRISLPMARVTHAFLRAVAAPEVRRAQIALSLGTALCNVAAFALCSAAIGASLPLAAALVLVPLILFAMLIPVSVSGWGLREGAAAAAFPLVGATAAEGLAASVLFGLVMLAASLPGLAVLLRAPSVGPARS